MMYKLITILLGDEQTNDLCKPGLCFLIRLFLVTVYVLEGSGYVQGGYVQGVGMFTGGYIQGE